jgi:cell division septal protein FtsQ
MFFFSKKSPFSAESTSEDIGLGRQRREKRKRRVRRVLRVGSWLSAVLFAAWTLHSGIHMFLQKYVYTNDTLSLKRFTVRSQGVIPQRLLVQWTGLKPGDNLLGFELAEIKRNLELSPFIAEASVERVFPETLSIHVRERKPKARIQLLQLDGTPNGSIRLVPLMLDEKGVVMSRPTQGEIPISMRLKWDQLPEITGVNGIPIHIGRAVDDPRLKAAIHWVTTFQESLVHSLVTVTEVNVSEPDVIQVKTEDGQKVLFGFDDTLAQLAKWMQVIDFGREIGRRLSFLNLTIPNNMPFEWMPEEALQADERRNRTQLPTLNHVDV